MPIKVKNFLCGLFAISFSILIFFNSLNIKSIGYSTVSASFFPILLSIALFLLGIFLVLMNAKSMIIFVKEIRFEKPHYNRDLAEYIFGHKLLFTMIIVSLYCFGIGKIGFLSSSILYLFFQILLFTNSFKKSKIATALGIAIAISLLVFIVFSYGFKTILPKGILI